MDAPAQSGPQRIERGGSQSDLRRFNEKIVLTAVSRYPGMFNAELARRTGLAAQTISVILRSLDAQGLIRRGAVLRGRRGQPATPIFLRPEGAYSFGIDVGWKRVVVTVVDLTGALVARESWRQPYPDPDELIPRISATIERMIAALPKPGRSRARRVGVALPSRLIERQCKDTMPASVEARWQEIDFGAELGESLGLPIGATKRGLAACWAQAAANGPVPSDFAYAHIGSRLISGVSLNGRTYMGSDGMGSDFSAMLVPGADRTCVNAGEILSIDALDLALQARGFEAIREDGGDTSLPDHKAVVDDWLGGAGEALAHLVLNIESVVAVGTVVIDGLLPRALLERLLEEARIRIAALKERAPRPPALVMGTLGGDAAALGAALLPLQQDFFSPEVAG